MKYFKNDTTGAIYAYENDGSQDDCILPSLRQMTAAEVHAHLNPPPAPPRAPEKITRAQGRLALYRAGLWPQVQAVVAGITDPTEAFEADAALNHTVDWERSSPFLCRAAQALGLDDATLDELFRTAAQIVP